MDALEGLGGETWFHLGDGDLAMHVARTHRLRAGEPLSSVTADICKSLGIAARILPASDDPVRTIALTDEGDADQPEASTDGDAAEPEASVEATEHAEEKTSASEVVGDDG